MPDLRIARATREPVGVIRGGWHNVTVVNRGRASSGATTLRARLLDALPRGMPDRELGVYTCVVGDHGVAVEPPTCPTVAIGPLAPGEQITVRAFVRGAHWGVNTPYTVQLGVDVCGEGYGPGSGAAPNCLVPEMVETNNTIGFTVR